VDLLAGVLAHDRLEVALQRADTPLELVALAGVLEDLPGPEQPLADSQAGFAKFLLDAAAFGVKGKVALRMRPADLPATDGKMAIGPSAIGRDDRGAVGESPSRGPRGGRARHARSRDDR
jgi:hypothetical protein